MNRVVAQISRRPQSQATNPRYGRLRSAIGLAPISMKLQTAADPGPERGQ